MAPAACLNHCAGSAPYNVKDGLVYRATAPPARADLRVTKELIFQREIVFIDNAANAAFNTQTISMILIIENEIFAQNIVEKRNGKEILGSWLRESLSRKRSGSLRSICRLLCTTRGDNVFLAHCQHIATPRRQRKAGLLRQNLQDHRTASLSPFFTTHCHIPCV